MRHAPSRTRRSAAGAACASLSGRACARSGEHEHVPPMDGLAEAPTHDGERVRRASALSGNRQIIAWHCRPLAPVRSAQRVHSRPTRCVAQEYFALMDKDGDRFLLPNEYLARAWPTDGCTVVSVPRCRLASSLPRTLW